MPKPLSILGCLVLMLSAIGGAADAESGGAGLFGELVRFKMFG